MISSDIPRSAFFFITQSFKSLSTLLSISPAKKNAVYWSAKYTSVVSKISLLNSGNFSPEYLITVSVFDNSSISTKWFFAAVLNSSTLKLPAPAWATIVSK